MKGEYVGHDWFVSSLFLLFSGKCDRVWHILMNLSQLLVSCYLWIPRLHSSVSKLFFSYMMALDTGSWRFVYFRFTFQLIWHLVAFIHCFRQRLIM